MNKIIIEPIKPRQPVEPTKPQPPEKFYDELKEVVAKYNPKRFGLNIKLDAILKELGLSLEELKPELLEITAEDTYDQIDLTVYYQFRRERTDEEYQYLYEKYLGKEKEYHEALKHYETQMEVFNREMELYDKHLRAFIQQQDDLKTKQERELYEKLKKKFDPQF